jgi:hypothetical protein
LEVPAIEDDSGDEAADAVDAIPGGHLNAFGAPIADTNGIPAELFGNEEDEENEPCDDVVQQLPGAWVEFAVPEQGADLRQTRTGPVGSADAPPYNGRGPQFKKIASEASKTATTPLDFFLLLFCSSIISMICTASNAYVSAVGARSQWKPFTRNRLLNFIAIIVYMGFCWLPSRSHYWEDGLFKPVYPSQLMSGRQFDNCLTSFKLNEMIKI